MVEAHLPHGKSPLCHVHSLTAVTLYLTPLADALRVNTSKFQNWSLPVLCSTTYIFKRPESVSLSPDRLPLQTFSS